MNAIAKSCALACILASAMADAQNYPSKPVRIIVPFSAGSGSDVFARTLGPKFTETWGQQIVVENREGAGGQTRAVNRGPACGM
jgi:tripartite-type tricarboxylate transporter receptor subunit TctC